MSDFSPPSYWYGAGPDFSGLANAQASQASINAQQAQQQAMLAQANSYNPWANTPGGFGAQTAYYQQQAANSYGNINSATLYPSSVGGSTPSQEQPKNVFDYGTSAFNPYGGAGGFQTFDPGKYYQQNPDVWSAGADAWKHYNQFGKNEGREGTWGNFDTGGYLAQNPDVAKSGMDPTAHWFQYGAKEGRQGSGLSPLSSYQGTGFDAFDPNIYGGSHPTAGFGQQPKAAAPQQNWQDLWKDRGPYQRGAEANTGRDDLAASYYANNRDVYDAAVKSGQNLTDFGLNHIMAYGQDEGRTFFDPYKYGQENPDVLAAGADPTAHWFQYGQKEGRAAPQSSVFNKETYLLNNPDVAAAGVDPTRHWLEFGQKENRMGGAFESALQSSQFPGTTYRAPWEASIPQGRYSPDVASTVKNLSAKYGWDPAALAAVIQMESTWDPKKISPTGTYRGMTQMGENTFKDAGGKLGGLTWDQYLKATAAQQVNAYGDWIEQGAKVGPGTAASLVKGGIGSLPPEMQAAIMQGTQFAPNSTSWVKALGEGNMSTPTASNPGDQAGALGNTSISAMRDAFARIMAAWPQNQSPWPR